MTKESKINPFDMPDDLLEELSTKNMSFSNEAEDKVVEQISSWLEERAKSSLWDSHGRNLLLGYITRIKNKEWKK